MLIAILVIPYVKAMTATVCGPAAYYNGGALIIPAYRMTMEQVTNFTLFIFTKHVHLECPFVFLIHVICPLIFLVLILLAHGIHRVTQIICTHTSQKGDTTCWNWWYPNTSSGGIHYCFNVEYPLVVSTSYMIQCWHIHELR